MRLNLFTDMSRCTPDEVQRLLPLASTQRQEQAMRYKHLEGQYACLQSYVMLLELLAEEQADSTKPCGNAQLPMLPLFDYNPQGKPFLRDCPQLHFNISHCPLALAVVVDQWPVGVDVERCVVPNDRLLRYTLNDQEQEQVRQSADPGAAFARLWTRKEALVKLRGTGLSHGLPHLLEQVEPDIELHTTLHPTEGFVCTVARTVR